MIVTRFAPSPTGSLHVGNIRAALHNWMLARRVGGRFLLRIDDTDAERSREEFVLSIRADLAWLGLDPDGEERQSARFDLYETRFAALRDAGRVYPCYERPQELDLRRKILLGRGLPPVYDRAALALSGDERAALEAEGRSAHWRFKLDHDAPIAWDDGIRGEQHFDPKLLSDPVVRRADGSWLYLLPSVIDDIDMGISDIVRGEDHVSNTATQIQMFAALGAPAPRFAHEALLVGSEGKLSKRLGSLGVAHFREQGMEPITLVALLARQGTADPVVPVTEPQALIESFALDRFGRAPARFDEAELAALNQRIVHMVDFEAVRARLPEGMTAAGWEAIRPNLHRVDEAADWWSVVTGPVAAPALEAEDAAYVAAAREALAGLQWGESIWAEWTAKLKEATGRKGRALFLPLRLALTGRDHGPDMAALLPLIGRDAAQERLAATTG